MANQSVDLQGPEFVRKLFIKQISGRGYHVQDTTKTDEMLRTELGITEGGQLGSTTPEEVCKVLGVDAAIYGEIIDFKYTNIGFYQNKLVQAAFKMVGKDGQALWEDQRRASKK